MQRAAVSIPSNIAEGYERNTNKNFVHFLYIAKGSCGELWMTFVKVIRREGVTHYLKVSLCRWIAQSTKRQAVL